MPCTCACRRIAPSSTANAWSSAASRSSPRSRWPRPTRTVRPESRPRSSAPAWSWPLAITCGDSRSLSEVRRRFDRSTAADGRRALARVDAASCVVGARRRGRRPGRRAGDPLLRSRPPSPRRGPGARCRLDPGPDASPPPIDVVDATAALLRFDGGAIGSFANTRRLASSEIEIEFVSDDLLTTLRPEPDRRTGRLAGDVRRRRGGRARAGRARSVRGAGRGVPRRGRRRRPEPRARRPTTMRSGPIA